MKNKTKTAGGILLAVFTLLFRSSLTAQNPYTCPDNVPQCATVQATAPNNKPVGWIVGEIRGFAFGGNPGKKPAKILTQLHSWGWIECEGQMLAIRDFPVLHDAIGETWGSNAPTQTFFVPDLRGAFLRGWNHAGSQQNSDGTVRAQQFPDPDANSRIAPRTRADVGTGGLQGNTQDAVGSMQASALQHHKHLDAGHSHDLPLIGQDTGAGGRIGADSETQTPPRKVTSFVGSANIGDAVATTSSAPVQVSDETRPTNASVMYFIYVGKDVSSVDPATGRDLRAQDSLK